MLIRIQQFKWMRTHTDLNPQRPTSYHAFSSVYLYLHCKILSSYRIFFWPGRSVFTVLTTPCLCRPFMIFIIYCIFILFSVSYVTWISLFCAGKDCLRDDVHDWGVHAGRQYFLCRENLQGLPRLCHVSHVLQWKSQCCGSALVSMRIRVQHFLVNADPDADQGFWWPKIEKKLQLKNLLIPRPP